MAHDQLLSSSVHLTTLQPWLDALLPAGHAVAVDEPPAGGPTPFTVLSGALKPIRMSLAGSWSMAELYVVAETVHDSALQARAGADLVRTAFVMSVLPLAGVLDIRTADDAFPRDPGGVHQVRESWTITLTRV